MAEETKIKRRSFFGVFIGTNRTGKSATARRYAESWKKHNPGKKIMAFDPQDSFKGLVDYPITLDNEKWDETICTLRNGLLILDDFRILQDSGAAARGLKKLLNYRAKWNVDIIMICHSPSLVVLFMTAYITHYYIFRIQAVKSAWNSRIPNAEICLKSSNLVNEYFKECSEELRLRNPVEYDKQNGNPFKWPFFPHIIIDTQTDRATLQNIETAKLKQIVNRLKL